MKNKSTQDDYDSPWKEAIEQMLPDFMAFYFPAAWGLIDWRQGYHFLEQELRQLVPVSTTGARVVDKLVQVTLHGGATQRIYIHIEIQSSRDPGFAERMYIYHYRIFDLFKHPVASFAVLADNHPRWRPTSYQGSLMGCHWRLDFPTVKLLDYQSREDELLVSDNPFGLVTVAHLYTRRTRGAPGQRYQAKFRLLRLLYGRGWEKGRIIQLLRVIDWLMALPPALEQSLRREIATREGVESMQYVTSFERLAKQEGREEGGRALLMRLLNRRFGPLPEALGERVQRASSGDLDTWADRVLDARSLDEVFGGDGARSA